MVNVIANLNDGDCQILSREDCLKYVKAIGAEIYENHLDLLKQNGIRWRSKNDAINNLLVAFDGIYVNAGVQRMGDPKLHNFISEHLFQIHVILQQLAALYRAARHIAVFH